MLAYNGMIRDRVGQSSTALGPDGALDGTLTATLSAPGGRTVTGLRLPKNAPRTWDTSSRTGFWVVAVAPTLAALPTDTLTVSKQGPGSVSSSPGGMSAAARSVRQATRAAQS
jgi:hypothetical protein